MNNDNERNLFHTEKTWEMYIVVTASYLKIKKEICVGKEK